MRLTDFEPFAVRHIVENMRPADRAEVFALRENDDEPALIRDIINTFQPFRFVAWGEHWPVAMFGANRIRPGVFQAYLVATEEFPLIGLPVTRFIKRHLVPAIERTGAHRCEAWSSAAHFWAHRWLGLLGATQEATLRRVGRAGEDFIVFRWDNTQDVRRRR